MEIIINYASFILHLLILKANCQISLLPGSHEFFVTETVRVKRQAGYVYNRPNIPFELPSQPMNVPTQEQNVDRTQAQQMYYAYPVPAVGQTANTGYSSGSTSPSSIQSVSSSGGYNYASQSGSAQGEQSSSSGTSQYGNLGTQASVGSTGYSYGGAAITSNTGQSSSTGASMANSDASSYRYDAPSSTSGANQANKQTGSIDKVAKTVQSQATSSSTSGYDYNVPVSNVGLTTNSQISISSHKPAGSGSSGYTSGGPTITKGSSLPQTATSSVSSSYRYESPLTSGSSTGTTLPNSSQSIEGSVSSGYGYNGPLQSQINIKETPSSLGSIEISTTADSSHASSGSTSSGYSYNGPSSIPNAVQTSRSFSTSQTSQSSGSTATSSVSTSYRYETPKNPVSNEEASLAVSTKTPGYLPPAAGVADGNSDSSHSLKQPDNLYKTPTISGIINAPVEKLSQSYLPASASTPLEPTPVVNPSQTYVPPSENISSALSLGKLSTSYVPPRGKVSSTSFVTPPSQSYIPPSESATPTSIPSNSYVPSSNAPRPAQPNQVQLYTVPTGQGSSGQSYSQPSQSYVPSRSSASADASVNLSASTSGQTSGNTGTAINTDYLPPNKLAQPDSSGLPVPKTSPNTNYIPPSGSSNKQGIFSTPSATYLPPVF